VGIIHGRPFAQANAAAAWLAAAHLLDSAALEVDPADDGIIALVRRVRSGAVDEAELATELSQLARRRSGPWRRAAQTVAARLMAPAGPAAPVVHSCPACGRRLEIPPAHHRSMVGCGPETVRIELTARCWYLHREHRRDGRAFGPQRRTTPSSRSGRAGSSCASGRH
jgi:hypothetical protein